MKDITGGKLYCKAVSKPKCDSYFTYLDYFYLVSKKKASEYCDKLNDFGEEESVYCSNLDCKEYLGDLDTPVR